MFELTDRMPTKARTQSSGSQTEAGPAAPSRRGREKEAERRNEAMPHLIVAEGLLPVLHDYIRQSCRQYGEDVENGGMLVGEYAIEGGRPVFKLNGLIGAGPRAEVSTESVLFDADYQFRVLQAIRRHNPRTGNMGCIHLHPAQMDECSVGDYLADVAAVRESDTKALVFGIITRNNPRRGALSLAYRNCKFDFFILGQQTDFEYVHVRPSVADLPVLKVTPALEQLAEREPPGDEGSPKVHFGCHQAWGAGLLADKRRLVAEVRTMQERYGDRAVLKCQANLLYWEYTVVESGRRFPIEVRYPRRYPLEPPRVISVLPLPSSPHQLVNNELCWINRASGDWNPSRDTAATCIHAAHRWFACLLVYLTLGQWPEEANDEPLRMT